MEIKEIAFIQSPYKTKFGIPRQSGLASEVRSRIVFCKEFRNPDALRGLEEFSHLWLIWGFSANRATSHKGFQATVRPPRLGGNESMGVFATRSPFRPNPLGLSCVKIDKVIVDEKDGPVIDILGADLMDGTPIYDIKPYVKYSDCMPDAVSGFVDKNANEMLEVRFSEEVSSILDRESISQLTQVLKNNPRPSYQDDPGRIYGMLFNDWDIHFTIVGNTLNVISIDKN